MRISACCLFLIILIHATGQEVSFVRITSKEGLSQSEVYCITQDSKGYIWVGTLGGLNRYNGYFFEVYRNNSLDSTTISANNIRSICQDKNGNLWIGTRGGGVSLYNYKTNNFTSFKHSETIENSIANNNIDAIFETSSGFLLFSTGKGICSISTADPEYNTKPSFKLIFDINVNQISETDNNIFWLATDNGIYKVKIENEKVEILSFIDEKNYNIIAGKANSIYAESNSIIWAATDKGLLKIIDNKGSFGFTNYKEEDGLGADYTTDIYEDESKNLWIGTRGGGLSLLNRSTNKITNYRNSIYFEKSLSGNSVSSIFEDKTGVLWIGTNGNGLNNIDLRHNNFDNYKIILDDKKELPSNFIRAIYQDTDGIIWLGTLNGGMFKYDRTTDVYTNLYFKNTLNEIVQNGYHVFDIQQFDENKLIVATNQGLCIYNEISEQFTYYRYDRDDPTSLASNSVFNVKKDDHGVFWVGTWFGLHKFNYKEGNFERFRHQETDPKSISNDVIVYIYNDPLCTDIWIGTMYGGLSRMVTDPATGKVEFINYVSVQNDPNSLSDNKVNMVLRSKKGDIWVATENGLNKLVAENGTSTQHFIRYTEINGLANNSIKSILEDENGNLWMGTNNKLSMFNPETNTFKNYSFEDGLQSNEFSEHTCIKGNNGEVFFGGVNGFNTFYPDELNEDTVPPITILTKLEIYYNTIEIGEEINGKVILNKSINEVEEISLGYKENNFTIHFAGLHFSAPQSNMYKYRLRGYDKDWLSSSVNNRFAKYTNLNEGRYYFEVLSANSDGYWTPEPKILKITIKPPYWRTWWFKLGVGCFVIAVFILFFFWKVRDIKQRNIELEAIVTERTQILKQQKEQLHSQNEELIHQAEVLNETNTQLEERQQIIEEQAEELRAQKESLEETNATKDKFFSILAHDLKNPFHSLLGYLDLLKLRFKSYDDEKKEKVVGTIHESALLIYKLMENLLQWSRSQRGLMPYMPQKINLQPLVNEELNVFKAIANEKKIELNIDFPANEIVLVADDNMLRSVIRNLLSNSIKFTDSGGKVNIAIESLAKTTRFSITDTGTGIPSGIVKDMFRIDRYYTTEGTAHERGTGLGLILCKEFVEKHNGKIWVVSTLGTGSTFFFEIPNY